MGPSSGLDTLENRRIAYIYLESNPCSQSSSSLTRHFTDSQVCRLHLQYIYMCSASPFARCQSIRIPFRLGFVCKVQGDVSAVLKERIPEPTAAVGVRLHMAGCKLGCRQNHIEMRSQLIGMQAVHCSCTVNNRVRQKEL